MKITRRERWVLIVGGAVALSVAVAGWGVLPFLESRARVREEIEIRQRRLQAYLTLLERRGRQEAELQALQERRRRLQTQILLVSDAGSAELRVRELLTQYAQANGVNITRTNILQEEKLREGYSKVAIDFNVTADIGPLTRFLTALVTNPNILEIRQINVNAYMNKNQVVLQPRITLAALLRKG